MTDDPDATDDGFDGTVDPDATGPVGPNDDDSACIVKVGFVVMLGCVSLMFTLDQLNYQMW